MSDDELVVHARVRVVLDVKLSRPWNQDITRDEVHETAEERSD